MNTERVKYPHVDGSVTAIVEHAIDESNIINADANAIKVRLQRAMRVLRFDQPHHKTGLIITIPDEG